MNIERNTAPARPERMQPPHPTGFGSGSVTSTLTTIGDGGSPAGGAGGSVSPGPWRRRSEFGGPRALQPQRAVAVVVHDTEEAERFLRLVAQLVGLEWTRRRPRRGA